MEPKLRDKEFIAAELSRCNRCGYCMQSCPAYRATRTEVGVARGRNHVLRGVVDGNEDLTPQMKEPFFDCLLCGACTQDCFGKVRTKDLMVRAREAYGDAYGEPALRRFLFRKLLPRPDRLRTLVGMAALGKLTGLPRLAQHLGLLHWLSPSLEVAEGLVPDMPLFGRFLRDRLRAMGFTQSGDVLRLEPEHAGGAKVLYFIGCGTNFQLPDVGEDALKLLVLGGCQVTIAPNCCCGLPPWSYGDIEAARMLAKQNLDTLGALDFDALVTDCGSCSGFLKQYPELLPDDPRAADLASRTRDLTEVLAELDFPRPTGGRQTVTYHDPCHLGRGQGVREQPRRLLVDAAGLDLIELPESERCCGGAGSFNLSHPRLSGEILGRKMDNIARTGADVIATACPACIMQLGWGARNRDMGIPVEHVAEILARRQGLR